MVLVLQELVLVLKELEEVVLVLMEIFEEVESQAFWGLELQLLVGVEWEIFVEVWMVLEVMFVEIFLEHFLVDLF